MNNEFSWAIDAGPIVFLRPAGIDAGDALRLMEAARALPMSVRWRLAPLGVAPDAYLAHKRSLLKLTGQLDSSNSSWEATAPAASPSQALSEVNEKGRVLPAPLTQLQIDMHGWHRGRPVCVLGQNDHAAQAHSSSSYSLLFPNVLSEMQQGLEHLLEDLIGVRMLYLIGAFAMGERERWHTHHLHLSEAGQLIAVLEPREWRFHLLEGCSVERLEKAALNIIPRSGGFEAQGFQRFALELALWEFAKRCPEEALGQMLPSTYMSEPLVHRRSPRMKNHAMGDHCVAILTALGQSSRTADELQTHLGLTRVALVRAMTCLALVRAIKTKNEPRSLLSKLRALLPRRRKSNDEAPSSKIGLR